MFILFFVNFLLKLTQWSISVPTFSFMYYIVNCYKEINWIISLFHKRRERELSTTELVRHQVTQSRRQAPLRVTIPTFCGSSVLVPEPNT